MVIPSVPQRVYLETSVAAAAIIGGTAHSRASLDFCEALSGAKSTVYYSRLVRIEVLNVLKKYATKNLIPSQLREDFQLDQFSDNLMIRQRWLNFGMRQFDILARTFYQKRELPMQRDMHQRCANVMSQHNLDSYDAMHVAVAMSNGLSHIATLDADFTRVRELKVLLIRDAAP